MSPREFYACIKGHQARTLEQYRLAAWQLSYTLKAWTGERFTVEQLLGQERKEELSFFSGDEFRAYANAKQAELKARKRAHMRGKR
jgi:hypothetical protein